MGISDWMDKEQKYIMQTYARLPVVFVRGQGSRLWDEDGAEYIDFVSGLGVCSLGHAHAAVVEAVRNQVGVLIHTSNLYYTKPQIELAEKLIDLSFEGRCFFANSGAEANEAAIKLARKHAKLKAYGAAHSQAEAPYEIITAENSFHGRTLATLAATGQREKQKPFEPMPAGFKQVPFNDVDALRSAIDEKTCAVMLEPIQGEGGVHVATRQYLQKARELCDENGLLLILDEVQTGMGRTGKMFAYQHYGIEPDMITLAKSLGGGLPIGALIARSSVADSFEKGDHGTTFGGSPLVCSAAMATLNVLENDGLVGKGAVMGKYLIDGLKDLKTKSSVVKEIRGMGLMVGVALRGNFAGEISLQCLKRGIVVNKVVPDTLRFLPPLTITREEIDELLRVLGEVIEKGFTHSG